MNQFGIGITIAGTMTYLALKYGYCSYSKLPQLAGKRTTGYLVPGTTIFQHHHAHPGLSTTN